MASKPEVTAFDTETSGLRVFHGDRIHRAGALDSNGRWMWRKRSQLASYHRRLLSANRLVAHHAKFDIHMLGAEGKALPWDKVDDTIVMAALLCDQHPKDLLWLSLKFLDYDGKQDLDLRDWVTTNLAKQDRGNYSLIPDKILEPYTKQQLINTICLDKMWRPAITRHYSEIYQNEMRLTRVLYEMECRGLLLDPEGLDSAGRKLRKIFYREKGLGKVCTGSLARKLRKLGLPVEFNPRSPKQVGQLLVEQGFKLPKKLGGAYQTDKTSLAEYQGDPLIDLILKARQVSKLQSTYVEGLRRAMDGSDVVHTTFSQHITRTGRLSSTDPNEQNIPTEEGLAIVVKQCFIAREGYDVFGLDLSAVELVMAMAYTGDQNAIELAQQGRTHIETARFMFGRRYNLAQLLTAKAVNFSQIYGGRLKRLARLMTGKREPNKADMENAAAFQEKYYQKFGAIKVFKGVLEDQLRNCGYVVDCFGRRYRVPWQLRHKAFNAITQGGCANLIKYAMVAIGDLIRSTDAYQLLQIHDELQIEIPKRKDAGELLRLIVGIMESVFGDRLPCQFRVKVSRWKGCWANEEAIDKQWLLKKGRIRAKSG